MLSSFKLTFNGLRAAALLGLLVCGVQSVVNAGVLTYTPGTGGTFDPSTASSFSGADAFTKWDVTGLSNTAAYSKVKVQVRWNGTGPLSPSSFDITGISLSDPTTQTALSDISVSGPANSLISGSYVDFSSAQTFTKSQLDNSGNNITKLSFSLPVLSVNPGWYLEVRLKFSDSGESNENVTAWQTATYTNTAVPEPGTSAMAGGLVALAIFVQRRRAKRSASTVNNAV